jgi:CHAD domain-containing protein
MRYAVEFFGTLFHPHSAAERYIDKAQALQDPLGQQNDATIALGLVKTLDFGADSQFAYAAGVAAGWYARSTGGDELRETWRSLRRAEQFWCKGG